MNSEAVLVSSSEAVVVANLEDAVFANLEAATSEPCSSKAAAGGREAHGHGRGYGGAGRPGCGGAHLRYGAVDFKDLISA